MFKIYVFGILNIYMAALILRSVHGQKYKQGVQVFSPLLTTCNGFLVGRVTGMDFGIFFFFFFFLRLPDDSSSKTVFD